MITQGSLTETDLHSSQAYQRSQISFLLVDNEPSWIETVSNYLEAEDFDVTTAGSLNETRGVLLANAEKGRRFDIVLTNLNLLSPSAGLGPYPQDDNLGIRVIRTVHQLAPGTPCFLVSGRPHRVNRRLRAYPEYVDVIYKDDLRLIELAEIAENLDTYRAEIQTGYGLLQSQLIERGGNAGSMAVRVSQEPISGIEALMDALADVPTMSSKIPALGVRLNTLMEIEQKRQALGMLSGTLESDRREAVYFAIVVCQELEQLESL